MAQASFDCLSCSIRRLSCDRQQPSCGVCLGAGHPCALDWTLGLDIYQHFPADMNLNGKIQLDMGNIAHATRTARIYRVSDGEGGHLAVKVLWENTSPRKLLQMSVREAWNWSELKHNNIVPLLGIADMATLSPKASPQLCMVSAWMEQGNIMDYIAAHPTAKRLPLLLHIVEGVRYLHSLAPTQIIHGDLKGNNILVDIVAGPPRARLIDFGLSSAIEDLLDPHAADSTSTSYRGNPRWLAFERVIPNKFGALNARDARSTSSDVFEMLRTFLQILTGADPYEGRHELEVVNLVSQGLNPEVPSPSELNSVMVQLMQQCWNLDRTKRPTLAHVRATVEFLAVEEAVMSWSDLTVIEALDMRELWSRHAQERATTMATPHLLRTFLGVLVWKGVEQILEEEEFTAVNVTIDLLVMAEESERSTNDLISLSEQAFHTLASLARKVGESAKFTQTVRARLPLPSLIESLTHLPLVALSDLRDIASLVAPAPMDAQLAEVFDRKPGLLDHFISLAKAQVAAKDLINASAALMFFHFILQYLGPVSFLSHKAVYACLRAQSDGSRSDHLSFLAKGPGNQLLATKAELSCFREALRRTGEYVPELKVAAPLARWASSRLRAEWPLQPLPWVPQTSGSRPDEGVEDIAYLATPPPSP